MDFHYSDIVRADTYNTDGLCAGIALRRHKDPIGEVAGALRCQSRWRVLVGPLTNYHGTLGHRFSFIRVTIPECLPERLEIVSFANEFAFLYDGETPQTSVRAVTARGSQEIDTFVEDIDQALQDESRRQILHEFGSDSLPHATHDRFIDGTDLKGNAAKQVQSLIVKEMMAIDKERGLTTMKAWQKFVQVVSSRQRSEPFRSLEEYLPYRISDAGELFVKHNSQVGVVANLFEGFGSDW
ncbi:MAG: hypothetical protein L6R38_001092 [Xanthoria sp. 2 TBL-2021]|nr:MAG: hypothetical protein L6R38_001092 [Xanthoria sp. 2 TBL-2021]